MKTPLLRFSVMSFFSISIFFGNSDKLWAGDNDEIGHSPHTPLPFNQPNVALRAGSSLPTFQEILEKRRPFLKYPNELKAKQKIYCGNLSDEELIRYYKENFTGPKFLSSPQTPVNFMESKVARKELMKRDLYSSLFSWAFQMPFFKIS